MSLNLIGGQDARKPRNRKIYRYVTNFIDRETKKTSNLVENVYYY